MMITFKGLLEYLFLRTFFNSCFSSLSKTYSITTRQKCDNSMCLLQQGKMGIGETPPDETNNAALRKWQKTLISDPIWAPQKSF